MKSDLLSTAWAALQPDAVLTVSQWADRYRVLDPVSSGYPGPWRTSRTPYLREPMDRLSPDDPCDFVVLMFASQLGKSEASNNWLGRIVHHSPGPILLVQPTVETAERYSRQRIARLIESTPELASRVSPAKSRDGGNTLLAKEFPGGIMVLAGSNAPAGLASMPVRYLGLDEVDRFATDCGGEGDPVELAIQRTAGFANRKILLTSTPTFTGASRIASWYERSDRRRYWVPCPHCGEFQVLRWSQVRWVGEDASTAIYECEHHGCVIENRHKAAMLPAGEWRPDDPSASGQIRGYTLSALYTPHGLPNDFAELARQWLLTHKDPNTLKTFINLKLGETFDPYASGGISDDYLAARCARAAERFGAWVDAAGREHDAPLPDGVLVLTAAVDVQDDRLEVEVHGWGLGEEHWSVDYRRLPGDLSAPAVWADLDEYLGRTWATESGWTLGLSRTMVDSGGHYTQAVYDFCRVRRARQIWPVKGRAGPLPIWTARPSKVDKGRVLLHLIGVDAAKELIYARLRIDEPGPGYSHVPLGRSEAYFRALVAERQERHRHAGQVRLQWVLPPKRSNEALDLRVYGYAGLLSWLRAGHRLEEVARRRASGAPVVDAGAPAAHPKRRAPSAVPGTPGWLAGVPTDGWVR